MRLPSFLCLAWCSWRLSNVSAQDRRLTVLVDDPSGATIPGASIIVLAGSDLIAEQMADAKGVALITLRSTAGAEADRHRAGLRH